MEFCIPSNGNQMILLKTKFWVRIRLINFIFYYGPITIEFELTVAGCHPYLWLQFGDWTNIDDSERHSAKTSPPI